MDIATLGYEIRSGDLATATNRLDGMTDASRRTESATQRLDRQLQRTAQTLKRLAAAFVSLEAGRRIMGAAIREARQFGLAIAEVSTLVRDTSSMDGMTASVRRLSREYGSAPVDQAKALYQAISAGAKEGKEAVELLDLANKVAIGGVTDVATAVDILTTATNAYAASNLKATDAADILFVGMRAGKTTIGELSANLGQLIPTATAAGVEFETIVAATAALTTQGQNTAMAVVGLNAALSSIISPTSQAAELADRLGIEFNLTGLRARGFAGFMEHVTEKTGGSEEALSTLFGSIRAGRAVFSLAGQGGVVFNEIMEDMADRAGSAERAFGQMSQTADFALNQMREAMRSLFIDLGDRLLTFIAPAARTVAENIELIAASVTTLAKITGTYLAVFVLLPAAYNLATTALLAYKQAVIATTLAKEMGIAQAVRWSSVLSKAASVVFAAFAGWQIGTMLREQFVEVEIAGIALVGGLLRSWEKLKAGAELAWEAIKAIFLGGINVVKRAIADLIDLQAGIGEKLDVFGIDTEANANLRALASTMRDEAKPAADLLAEAAVRINATMQENILAIDETMEGMVAYAIESRNVAEATDAVGDEVEQLNAELAALAKQANKPNAVGDPKKLKDMSDAMDRNVRAAAAFRASLTGISNQMAGPALAAHREYNRLMDEARQLYLMGIITKEDAANAERIYGAALEKTLEEIEANSDAARELESILSRFDNIGMSGLIRDMDVLREKLDSIKDKGSDAANEIRAAMRATRGEMILFATDAIGQGISSLQSMATEGSKAYKALAVAQAANNVVAAIGAIVNQGMGDPYTAFARMAAMAAAVSQLVDGIGSFSGGFVSTAEQRQSTQGRGTVLGDAEAQSESIANAIEITADATSALVGINRGMLRALLQLQQSIGNATGMIARGASDSPFSDLPAAGQFRDVLPAGLGNIFRDPLNLLGGSSRITDQGIVIMGGALADMMQTIAVGAYQEVQTRRWRFGSRRTSEEVVGVTDELSTQFGLIMESIYNTVLEGAIALGMLPADVQAALDSFRVEEIRISLMDLTAEEQQAELAAVFSTIFDNLAGHVVPFIGQFQRVGEGLGETLVRVATSVQVTREAIFQLGFALGDLGPEQFAQMSVSLIELAGGIEEFITQMQSFVEKFAPESHKFAVAQDALTRGLEQVGLSLPATRDGMWELMQSLDATTEAGREQIATLLRLADVADSYYSALERQGQEMERQMEALRDYAVMIVDMNRELATFDMNDFQRGMFNARTQYLAQVQALNDVAQSAGLTAARTEDLGRAQQMYARQVARLVAQLIQSGQQLAAQLGLTPLSAIEAEIARIQSETQTSMGGIGQAFRDATAEAQSFADALLIGDMSPLGSAERLAEAIRQFNAAQTLAERQQIGQTILGIGRERFASGGEYARLFEMVQQGLRGFSDPGTELPQQIGVEVSSALAALFRERDQLLAEEQERQRLLQARDLAQIVADLMQAQGISMEDAFAQLGILPEQLMDILGLDADKFGEFIASLAVDAVSTADAIFDSTDRIVDELVLIRDLLSVSVDRFDRDVDDETLVGGRRNGRNGSQDDPEEERPIEREIADRTRETGDSVDLLRQDVSELLRRIDLSLGKNAEAGERTANAVETIAFSGGGFSDRTAPR